MSDLRRLPLRSGFDFREPENYVPIPGIADLGACLGCGLVIWNDSAGREHHHLFHVWMETRVL